MSRATSGDVVVLKPTNNVYTVLAAIGVIVNILGFLALFMRASQVFPPGKGLF